MDANNNNGVSNGARIRRLIMFFAILNIADGLGDTHGLLDQPLMYFLKEVHGWTADGVTRFMALLVIPWLVRPLYGLISDCVPFFGYRRKSYLVAANLVVLAACVWLARLSDPLWIWLALFLVSVGTAVNSTISGALTVENGRSSGLSAQFVQHSWMWFSAAQVLVSICGGWLSDVFTPADALHWSAWIVALAPLAVILATVFLVDEARIEARPLSIMVSLRQLARSVYTRQFLVVAVFLFLFALQPSFYTPLYYHMTDTLHFHQNWIGWLHSVWFAGAVVGTLLFGWLERRMEMTGLIKLAIGLDAFGIASYLALSGFASALVVNFVAGVTTTIASVACMALAAKHAPDGSEGFSYALLLAIQTIAGQVSSNVGSLLYVYVFGGELSGLLLTAFACCLLHMLTLKILRLGKSS